MDAFAQQSNQSASELFGSNRMWGLKEPSLPEAVDYLPQTAGWVVLGVVVLVILAWLAWRRYRQWQRNAYRREALVRLATISDHPEQARMIPFILRKAALCAVPDRGAVASLHGSEWTQWLNQSAGEPLFDARSEELLDQLAYLRDPGNLAGIEQLLEATRIWVKAHHAAV